ncbi:hypothetical protein [Bradyrhizobium nanningense]|nr:hypothetical protein [Bradyrhizobium nanningense]
MTIIYEAWGNAPVESLEATTIQRVLDTGFKGTPAAGRVFHSKLGRVITWAREFDQTPWSANDAERHTHKATTWELKELWAKIANDCLERTGDEGRAIREANAVIARQVKDGGYRPE